MRLSLAHPRALLLLPVQLVAANSPVRAQSERRAQLSARLDSAVTAFMASTPVVGLTAAVVSRGDTLLLKGYGEADREHHRPASATTVYKIGSITKQFTAAAVMRLVEEGRVSLDDPVTKYLPQFAGWSGVHIRHLLNHTSGIPGSSPEWVRHRDEELSQAQLVAYLMADTLETPPGARFRYNNNGYVLLGLVIEAVTGRAYAQHLAETIFQPLGMRSASSCLRPPRGPAEALGYDRALDIAVPTAYPRSSALVGAGDLCMSVPDYLRWQSALVAGRVISRASFQRMSTSDTASGRPTGYGFGLGPGMAGGHPTIWHNGAVNGAQSQAVWMPDDSLQVVLFTNTMGSALERLSNDLAAIVVAAPPTPDARLVAAALPPDAAARYAGTYDAFTRLGFTTPLSISMTDSGLVARVEAPGHHDVPLVYLGKDSFGSPRFRDLRLSFVVSGDRATTIQLSQGGPPRVATRHAGIPLPAADRERFVGTYDLAKPAGGTLTIHVFADGPRLATFAEGPGQGLIPLFYLGDGSFGAAADPTLRLTFVNASERATSARLEQRGRTMEGPRRP